MTGRPAYRIPSLSEIESLPWNGFRVASTFSGCGGSCLGYRMAGYRVTYANEFIDEARATYKANHPLSFLDGRDIREVTAEDLMTSAGVAVGELDLLDGSPPCSAFSAAGRRDEGWGKVKTYSDKAQRVDDLFFEYVRILEGVQPKVFVAENVAGLVRGRAVGYFRRIFAALEGAGYDVACRVLDAQWLGVPQQRRRVIFIGVRKDLGLVPVFPQALPYRVTVGEAVAGLPAGGEAKKLTPGTDTYRFWEASKPGESLEMPCLRLTGRSSFRTHYRLSPKLPSWAITQAAQQLYHWAEPRTLTLEELRRVGGFPDDFVLTGTFARQWERIGRAVPPPLMAAVARTVETEILRKIRP